MSELDPPKFVPLLGSLEAGDASGIEGILESDNKKSRDLSERLLSGYGMTWALNQAMYIVNTRQTIPVNAYKLATKSRAFKELIRATILLEKNKSKKTESDSSAEINDCIVASESKMVELLVYCAGHSACISDLWFALHYCHIDQCHISGIRKLITGNGKESGSPFVVKLPDTELAPSPDECIYKADQVHLWKYKSICTLECGLRVAATYGLMNLDKLCFEYIKSTINPQNCWTLWRVAAQSQTKTGWRSKEMKDTAPARLVHQYIQANFSQLMRADARIPLCIENCITFEELCADELEILLGSDKLNVKQESEVVQAIELWLRSKARANEDPAYLLKVPRLLNQCVRIDQLRLIDTETILKLPGVRRRTRREFTDKSPVKKRKTTANPLGIEMGPTQAEYLNSIRHVRRHLYRSSRNLRPINEECGSEKLTKEKRKKYINEVSENSGARIPHEAIFLFGGWKVSGPCRDVCVFDARQKKWILYGAERDPECNAKCGCQLVLPYALMSFGIALVQNRYVYIAGGEQQGSRITGSVICYDLWNCDTDQDIAKDTNGIKMRSGWKLVPPLHEARRDFVLVNLNDETLYAVGGDNNRNVLSMVECYSVNPTGHRRNRGWSEAPSMLMARGAPAADCLNGCMYVCGGYTESRMEALTSSCEMYCPIANQWTLIRPMVQARYYAHALAVDGVLFVIGGGGENESRGATRIATSVGYSSTVERYDPHTGTWELMPPIAEKADFAACLFEGEIVCLGGGGETFCTNEVNRWKPWIPKHQVVYSSNGSRTNGHRIGGESRGPRWLTANVEGESHINGWRKSEPLPYPVWGHRCVVVRTCDVILPYIDRRYNEISEMKNEEAETRLGTKCITIHDRKVLVPVQFPEINVACATAIHKTDENEGVIGVSQRQQGTGMDQHVIGTSTEETAKSDGSERIRFAEDKTTQ